MAHLLDRAPVDGYSIDDPVPFFITARGLRALGRPVPVGLPDRSTVNQIVLCGIEQARRLAS